MHPWYYTGGFVSRNSFVWGHHVIVETSGIVIRDEQQCAGPRRPSTWVVLITLKIQVNMDVYLG